MAADWLGKEIEPVFTAAKEDIGKGSVTGKRKNIVDAVERTHALLLGKALSLHGRAVNMQFSLFHFFQMVF